MGKGTIISNLSNGLYKVEVNYDWENVEYRKNELISYLAAVDLVITGYELELASLTQEYYAAENDRKPGIKNQMLQKEALLNRTKLKKAASEMQLDYLNNIEPDPIQDIWSSDFTIDHNVSDIVGLHEIAGDIGNGINIVPGYESATYNRETHGQQFKFVQGIGFPVTSAIEGHGLLGARQKWQPTTRYGTITRLDGDLCDITVDVTRSTRQNLDINQYRSYRDSDSLLINVPIEYMECDGAAFSENDRVLILFENHDWETPKVIGFEDNPIACYNFQVQPNRKTGDIWYYNVNDEEIFEATETTTSTQYTYMSSVYGNAIPAYARWVFTRIEQAANTQSVLEVRHGTGQKLTGDSGAVSSIVTVKVVDYQLDPEGVTAASWWPNQYYNGAADAGGIISPDGTKIAVWAIINKLNNPITFIPEFVYKTATRDDLSSPFVWSSEITLNPWDINFKYDPNFQTDLAEVAYIYPAGPPYLAGASSGNIYWAYHDLFRTDTWQTLNPNAAFTIDFDGNLYIKQTIQVRPATIFNAGDPCGTNADFYEIAEGSITYAHYIGRVGIDDPTNDIDYNYVNLQSESLTAVYMAWDTVNDELKCTSRYHEDLYPKFGTNHGPTLNKSTVSDSLIHCPPTVDPPELYPTPATDNVSGWPVGDPYANFRDNQHYQTSRHMRDVVFYKSGTGFIVQSDIGGATASDVKSIIVNGVNYDEAGTTQFDESSRVLTSRQAIMLRNNVFFGEMVEVDGVKEINYFKKCTPASGVIEDITPLWDAESATDNVNPLFSTDLEGV